MFSLKMMQLKRRLMVYLIDYFNAAVGVYLLPQISKNIMPYGW
jgi:hypothetical protein